MDSSFDSFKMLCAIVRSAIDGKATILPDDKVTQDVLSLAIDQGILYLVCHGLRVNHVDIPSEINNELLGEIYQFAQNDFLLKSTKSCLEKADIAFVPLKGSIVRGFYPDQYMRASCDTDILVHEEDLENAIRVLVESGFTTDHIIGYHDVSLNLGEAHLELHFNICEHMTQTDRILKRAWNYIEHYNGLEWRETSTFYVFHTLAHMLYHFKKGGCGLKPFIDLWILKRAGLYNENELFPFLEKCNMVQFYTNVCETIAVWFEDGEPTELTKKIEKYIINGGKYGSRTNTQTMDVVLSGGRVKYFIRMAFLPLQDMRTIYKILNKYPVLLPICYLKRIYTKLIGRDKEQVGKQISSAIEINREYRSEIAEMVRQMGLR